MTSAKHCEAKAVEMDEERDEKCRHIRPISIYLARHAKWEVSNAWLSSYLDV